MKKIIMLGGSCCLIPVIHAAHKLNCFVIVCDINEQSPAISYADEYHKISVIDKEAILDLAKGQQVDGILSFACDLGVVTAAYVAHQLNLPVCGPYDSVVTLQNKNLFRAFLSEHHFNTPFARSYSTLEEAQGDVSAFTFPVIVKPVDSAGSKGVSKVCSPEELIASIPKALKYSYANRFIVEEFIETDGFSSDTDCFSVDGELAFVSFSNQIFDKAAQNPFAPSAYSWPSRMSAEHQKELASELQRLIRLLNMGTSLYNVETRVGTNGIPYIMEFTPRGGGNRLSEMLQYATGVDLIENAVRAALGEPLKGVEQKPYVGNWGIAILHSGIPGVYKGLDVDPSIKEYITEYDLWVEEGAHIGGFSAANEAIGTIVFRCDTAERLHEIITDVNRFIRVIVE